MLSLRPKAPPRPARAAAGGGRLDMGELDGRQPKTKPGGTSGSLSTSGPPALSTACSPALGAPQGQPSPGHTALCWRRLPPAPSFSPVPTPTLTPPSPCGPRLLSPALPTEAGGGAGRGHRAGTQGRGLLRLLSVSRRVREAQLAMQRGPASSWQPQWEPVSRAEALGQTLAAVQVPQPGRCSPTPPHPYPALGTCRALHITLLASSQPAPARSCSTSQVSHGALQVQSRPSQAARGTDHSHPGPGPAGSTVLRAVLGPLDAPPPLAPAVASSGLPTGTQEGGAQSEASLGLLLGPHPTPT
nr:translation initiation factor IF-2 isoform X2 [Oryctolagus cuniculus]